MSVVVPCSIPVHGHVTPLPAEADYDDADMDAAFPDRVGLTGAAGIRYIISAIFLRPAPSQLAALEAELASEPTNAVLVDPMFMGLLGRIRNSLLRVLAERSSSARCRRRPSNSC